MSSVIPRLNPRIQTDYCNAIKIGASHETAAALIGVEEHTVRAWISAGAEEITRRERMEQLEDAKLTDAMSMRELKRLRDESAIIGDSRQIYVDFRNEVMKSLAQAELMDLSTIQKATQGGAVVRRTTVLASDGKTTTTEELSRADWKASAWRLERRFPKRWAAINKTEISGPEGGPIVVLDDPLEHLEASLERLKTRLISAERETIDVSNDDARTTGSGT